MTPVPPRIYLQDTCLKHRFIRSKETSDVYERPERIRAINIAIAAVYARLESANPGLVTNGDTSKVSKSTIDGPLTIVRSAATLDMRVHKASIAVHSAEEPDGIQWFLADDIEEWCVESLQKIQRNQSEIPEKLEQDLYLCPESLQAFEAALGTVCEAVDHVCKATGVAYENSEVASKSYKEVGHPSPRAFVVIRPPGHHCGEDSPAGFGFVNNVAVGAFHAFEEHRLSRVVIFDYDLHHGNGTQELVRAFQTPKIYYGSMHDILSYPCEAGNQELISDASLQIHGDDGEWIHNVHLLPYKTEEEFWKHYKERYSTIFTKAEEFLQSTGGPGDDVIVFISCGFDASEYETTEMSRHDRHVPTSFYHRFTREACAFADKWAGGRLVSVLEGGYSDKALTSGAISHIAGLAEAGGLRIEKSWWGPDDLHMIDKVTSKRRGRKPKLDHFDWWLQRMQQIFQNINKEAPPPVNPRASQLFVPPPPPVLREETPETTPVRTRRRRTKPPPPPPTSMVTRKSKRSSPDDQEYLELSATRKRRRYQGEQEEEEEESSEEDSMDLDDDESQPDSRVDKGKGRAISSPRSSPLPKQQTTRAYVGSGVLYKLRQASNAATNAGLPTPLPSLEDVAAVQSEARKETSTAPSSSQTAESVNTEGEKAPESAKPTSNAQQSPTVARPRASATSSSTGTTTSAPTRSRKDVGATPASATAAPPAQSLKSPTVTSLTPSSQLSRPQTTAATSTSTKPAATSSSAQQSKPLQPSSQPSQSSSATQTFASPRLQDASSATTTPQASSRSPLIPASALSNRSATLDDAQRSLTNVTSMLSGHLSAMPDPRMSSRQASIDALLRQEAEWSGVRETLPRIEHKLSDIASRLQAMLKDMNGVKEKLEGCTAMKD